MKLSLLISKTLALSFMSLILLQSDYAAAIDSVLTCNTSGPILINGAGSRKINNDLIVTTSSIRYCATGAGGMTAYQFDYFGSTIIATRAYYSNGAVVLFNAAGALRAIVYTGYTGWLSAYQFDYENGVVVGTRSYLANGTVVVFSGNGTYLKTIDPSGTVATGLLPTFTSYSF